MSPGVDRACVTHHICECLQAKLDAAQYEIALLRESFVADMEIKHGYAKQVTSLDKRLAAYEQVLAEDLVRVLTMAFQESIRAWDPPSGATPYVLAEIAADAAMKLIADRRKAAGGCP